MIDQALTAYFLVTIKPFGVVKVAYKSEFNMKNLQACSFKSVCASLKPDCN